LNPSDLTHLDVERAPDRCAFPDPAPRKIGVEEWHARFKRVPQALIDTYRYFRDAGRTAWNAYLQPPSFFHIYGMRVLSRLAFDNGLASLRLWGFVLNEGERLYRARQCGRKVVALMGDYGSLAPLVCSFPGLVPFYPDFQYWTPFLGESKVLLDTAEEAGVGERCCFVRSALAAFLRRAYFPDPALVIASTGAVCDDLDAVAQRVQALGHPFAWFELPWRKSAHPGYRFGPECAGDPSREEALLADGFRRAAGRLSALAGVPFDEGRLSATLAKVERARSLIRRIRTLALSVSPRPLPALELMQVEFAGPHFYADLDECLSVLEDVKETVERRAAAGIGFGPPDASPVAWATPPADPVLLHRLEEMGGRLAATEFMIAQSRAPLDLSRPPLEALASSFFLEASLIGNTEQRARAFLDEAGANGARGAVISGLFASSHCVSETRILRDLMSKRLDGPVLAFDVPSPGGRGLRNPVKNRLAAYMETLKRRRRT